MQISVVIPVYKSEQTLVQLHRRLSDVLNQHDIEYEIILVEDCGGDNSWQVIQNILAEDKRVVGVRLTRNFGQHAATICGIAYAKGEWIVTMDDDLEQNPDDILRLISKAEEGKDLVYGVYPTRSHASWRNVTSSIMRKLFDLAIPNMNYNYSSFRVIRRDVAKAITTFDSPYPFIDGYLSWITHNYGTVEVEHHSRFHGQSTYTFTKLLKHSINIFVTFSDLPLKLVTWIGFVAFLIGAVWGSSIILMNLFGNVVASGFSSLMSGVVFFGGLNMLILGILGEYIGRINFKVTKKPLYMVSESCNCEDKTQCYINKD